VTQLAYTNLEEVKRHLRIPLADDYDDDYIQHLIYGASAAIKNYMGDKSVYRAALDEDDEPELDSNYEPILDSFASQTPDEKIRDEVKHAVLLLIGEWHRYRDGGGNITDNYLPAPVRALLYPLRDPQVN